jgi:signal transduction histidine kinase
MDGQDQQMEGPLPEITAALRDLTRLSHHGVSMTAETPPSIAVALLERLMLLCQASRGAIFLTPLHSADGESLFPSSALNGKTYRPFALHGVNEEEGYAVLTTASSESLWTSPPSRDPSWLQERLTLMMSFPSEDNGKMEDQERLDPTIPSLQTLLLFGWDGQDEENRVTVMKKACAILPFVADAVGTVIVRVLVSESINELEASANRKALREVELLKAELLATVSHELRSPLASIQGYAATLLRHERRISREKRHEFLLAINEASDRLAGVIDSLLEMSELETGTFEIERTPVNIARLVREAVTVAEQRLETSKEARKGTPSLYRHPTLAIHLEDRHGRPTYDELLIEADPNRLREVLDHLFKNAVTHSPEGGMIEVSIRPLLSPDDLKEFPVSSSEIERKLTAAQRCYQQLVVMSVQDSGRGIPTRHLTQIFDPFYRADTRLTREVNGLGLGLAICRRIVELHDGMLWVESEVGKGSTFYVCLPVGGNVHC